MNPNVTSSSSSGDALHIFPVEVWERVIQHACLDGGLTARMLSLASRSFYNITRRFRFWSLRIMDAHQMLYVAHILRRDPHALGEIRHLFLGATDLVVGSAMTFELDLESDNGGDDDVDSVDADPDYAYSDQPSTDEEDAEDFESSSESGDRLESWSDMDAEAGDEGDVDAPQSEQAAGGLDSEVADADDLDEDVTFFSSPEGQQWASSYDSSQPFALPIKLLESMRELLKSKACRCLESLTLHLTLLQSVDILDYVPDLPKLIRLSIISKSNPGFDLIPQCSWTSEMKFPKLRHLRLAANFRPRPWIDTILRFVNGHTERLDSLRYMAFDRHIGGQVMQILRADVYPDSIEAIVMDSYTDKSHDMILEPELAQLKILRKVHVVGLSKDGRSPVPHVGYWIRQWEVDIQGTKGSWERRYHHLKTNATHAVVEWVTQPSDGNS